MRVSSCGDISEHLSSVATEMIYINSHKFFACIRTGSSVLPLAASVMSCRC